MISTKQYRRNDDQGKAVIQIAPKEITSAAAKDDLLTVGNEREAENKVENMQPTTRLRVNPERCCGQRRTNGPPNSIMQIVFSENNADDPQGYFPTRCSKAFPPEGCSPYRWNGSQDQQRAETAGIIPKNPCCCVRLV